MNEIPRTIPAGHEGFPQESPSAAELRKLELIEKLAKSVRNRTMAMCNN
ncbi:MAG: hypothetical protein ACLPH3_18620 [Terracidiphilus sp.]